MPGQNAGMRVGTNFWFLSPGWAEEAWKAGVDFATTWEPWSTVFLGDLAEANYAAYRFMDFGGTNNSVIRNWSDRTRQSSPDNASAGDVHGRGIAYEWMFDLCNRMQKDCWITVPHQTIETYEESPAENFFTSLAVLAKQMLDPGLTLYLEYSNETWNASFAQSVYCQNRGTSMGLAPDGYSASFKFHVYASSRLYDSFRNVYGDEIGRVKWVISGQLGSDWGTTMGLQALQNPQLNLGGRTPDCYATSSYVSGGIDGAAPDVADQFRKALVTTVAQASSQSRLIASTGMQLVAYEGGQHVIQNADVLSANPIVYDLYKEWLDATAPLFGLTMHYANSGAWVSGGAWGAKRRTGAPLSEAPKARALVDWINARSRVAQAGRGVVVSPATVGRT